MKLIIFSCLVGAAWCMPQQIHRNQYSQTIKNNPIVNPLDDDEFISKSVPVPIKVAPAKEPTQWELEQNRNAHYIFSTNIDDKISDQTQQRNEVRDGLKVEGSYSYSDGYFQRTYHYVADDKGYRVVSSEVVPLDGPQVNLQGTASVDSAAHGTQVSYRVQSIPAVGQKIVDQI